MIRNVYFCSIKICALGFDKLLESTNSWKARILGKHFLHPALAEAFSLQKVVEILEEVVVSWREVRRIW